MSAEPVPTWMVDLVDDAALFPPSGVPLGAAVAEHREHRDSEYAALVGGFVVSDVKVPDLIDVLDEQDRDDVPLAVNLLVTGGAGAVTPAVRWASRAPSLRLSAIEVALRDGGDLAQNAQRFVAALDAVEEDLSEVDVYVELPWTDALTHGWLRALDVVAEADLRVKFRAGGVEDFVVPAPAVLASAIDAALDRELGFRCAGLVHALSRPEEHGFLNVLVATRACLDGDDADGALVETSADILLSGVDPDALARTRRWFTGFGSTSVAETHEDLVELGLLRH